MELIIVSGFIVFLPKYLETQFNLSKSMASMFTGGIAIPGMYVSNFNSPMPWRVLIPSFQILLLSFFFLPFAYYSF